MLGNSYDSTSIIVSEWINFIFRYGCIVLTPYFCRLNILPLLSELLSTICPRWGLLWTIYVYTHCYWDILWPLQANHRLLVRTGTKGRTELRMLTQVRGSACIREICIISYIAFWEIVNLQAQDDLKGNCLLRVHFTEWFGSLYRLAFAGSQPSHGDASQGWGTLQSEIEI